MSAQAENRYQLLRSHAFKVSRCSEDAEDLLQNTLLVALEAGRADLNCPQNRRWILGVMRKRALFEARCAVRRRDREQNAPTGEPSTLTDVDATLQAVAALPPALKTTALLALTGHTRKEMAWLLRISDAALRRRISDIHKRWQDCDAPIVTEAVALRGGLNFGAIRHVLRQPLKQMNAYLASHDPDGNLFILASQNPVSRQLKGTN